MSGRERENKLSRNEIRQLRQEIAEMAANSDYGAAEEGQVVGCFHRRIRLKKEI